MINSFLTAMAVTSAETVPDAVLDAAAALSDAAPVAAEVPQVAQTLGDKLLNGLSVTVVGMVVVFFGLCILIAFIKLLSVLKGGNERAPKAKAKRDAASATAAATAALEKNASAAASAAKSNAEAADALASLATGAKDTDAPIAPEIIAAISAAIAAYITPGQRFTVRRVRRVLNSPAWQRAGREDQTYSRF